MSLDPGPRHRQGHGPDPAPLLRAEGHVMYPEDRRDPPHKFRGRLQLLYDEWGTLKCETCFQCAQACPIECIDMGGMDTRGPLPRPLGRARDLRRAARGIRAPALRPDRPRPGLPAVRGDRPRRASTRSSRSTTTTRRTCSQILEATQAAYGYLPVAALKRISQLTGAWYAMIYGTASYYATSGSSRPTATDQAAAVDAHRPSEASVPRGARCVARRRRGAAPAAASRREPDAMVDLLKTPAKLADDPARTSRRARTRPTSTPRPGRARSTACAGSSATSGRPATIATIAASGLRGRGGAGFPTGDKWRTAAATDAPRRYVVANGYGADPATGTDRFLLERDPFAVIEGAAIAAFAIGATRGDHRRPGRGDGGHPAARGGHRGGRGGGLPRLRRPRLRARHRRSRSGRSRAPTCSARRRSCSRRSRASAASPSSGRRIRPSAACSACRPSSTTSRRWPPCPWIIRNGAEAFAAIGAPDSPGTILVQVRTPAGDGIAEVPLGTPLREVVGARRQAARAAARSRPSSSAARPAACSRRTCSTRRTTSSRCARPAPTSAPGRSSSPTTGPASSTSPGC